MDNEPLTVSVEEGTSDARFQHAERQVRHASKDNAISFNENIPRNSLDMGLSCDFGVSTTGTGQEMEGILNDSALHEDIGYLRLQNDFCSSIGNDYLLGTEFAENMEGLQSTVPGSLSLSSFSCIDTTWKADIFRSTDVSECPSHQLTMDSCGYGEIPRRCHLLGPSAEEKLSRSTSSCTLEDVGKFQSISSCSFQDILSDEADMSLSPSKEIMNSRKKNVNDEFVMEENMAETDGIQDESLARPSQTRDIDLHPIQKRSRKPTQRYIDELPDPVLRQSKKRRMASSSISKDQSPEVKNRKKCPAGSRPLKSPPEEFSVKAIQVPFGSLVHKECPESPIKITPAFEPPRLPEKGYPVVKSKESGITTRTQKRRNESAIDIHLKKDQNITVTNQKKRKEDLNASRLKKKNHHLKVQNPNKRDHHSDSSIPVKRDECLSDSEEATCRRKHHILWTITEVKQLIDGVSEFGVGKWSRIKKLFFSSSAHRTSVDLKDKWRNLLKASGLMEKSNHKSGGKRSIAWRPLPKSVMRRVCELAAMHPYPKGQKQRTPMLKYIHNPASPDRSTDMTLNDYRRILRTIDGN